MSYGNPYQSFQPPQPYGQYGVQPPLDPVKVNAPAISLIAVGSINLLQSLWALARNLLRMNADGPRPRNLDNNPALRDLYDAMKPYDFLINVSMSTLTLLCAAIIITAGVMMMQRKMYPLCVTGSVLAAIPCLSFLACCLIGEGVGI